MVSVSCAWAAALVRNSLTQYTGKPVRLPRASPKARAARLVAVSPPPASSGSPTTSRSARHSRTSSSMAVKWPSPAPTAMLATPLTVPVTVLPAATPMRRVPKSNDRQRAGGASGMAGVGGQRGEVDADLRRGQRPALLDRRVEDDARIGRRAQPGVLLQFVLELSRRPAGVAEQHQAASRAGALGDRLEDVQRRGQAEGFAHPQGRLPVAIQVVQHHAQLRV